MNEESLVFRSVIDEENSEHMQVNMTLKSKGCPHRFIYLS